ncbi:MAG: cation acetate symporter [Phycisphaerae bacterium]|nr:cation acetate symporter [Phycisphaerae bacterium]
MMVLAQVQSLSVVIFFIFVAFVLGLSFYLGRRAKSAKGYFAAGGEIPYAVNGIAFAGDYLSAASFLGICGMIATVGYDGYLYSIGYLAGWIVALFVVAEPMKRLGKYTFADALDAKFNSKGIQLAAAISTLIVSICYLIPQMVGAGALVKPLLGLDHAWGVIMVGSIVIFIVATAGMASTTWVQFLKGGLLIIFSTVIAIMVCHRGLDTKPDQGGTVPYYEYKTLTAQNGTSPLKLSEADAKDYQVLGQKTIGEGDKALTFVKLSQRVEVKKDENGVWIVPLKERVIHLETIGEALDRLVKSDTRETRVIDGEKYTVIELNGRKVLSLDEGNMDVIDGVKYYEEGGKIYIHITSWWKRSAGATENDVNLDETQWVTARPDGGTWINGEPQSEENQLLQVGSITELNGKTDAKSGPVGPFEFLAELSRKDTRIRTWKSANFEDGQDKVTVYYPVIKSGNQIMTPGQKFPLREGWIKKMDFASLMLALFFGTAALPHILIRYYTVRTPACARKSTIVAIAAIGFFYILTMYLGLGAMVNRVVNPASDNMSAPLLAKSFNSVLFAIISAIAFATVLGTVSGLIVAASGAVAHDIMDRFGNLKMNEKQKVTAGKLAAFTVGLVAIILGIVFKGMNVSYLVGWAFAVAASANLPAILMLLFWKKTTAGGIVASIIVGIIVAVGWILLSPQMFERYGKLASDAPLPFSSPGIVAIPASFITLVIVSLLTQKKTAAAKA